MSNDEKITQEVTEVMEEEKTSDKPLPLFHPAIPGVISIAFAVVFGWAAATFLDTLASM
jgi:hypothetical protein